MLNLLHTYMNQFPEYHPKMDGIEREISSLTIEPLVFDSQIRLAAATDLNIRSIKMDGFDPFISDFEAIRDEVNWLKDAVQTFYESEIVGLGERPTIKNVYRDLFRRVIRLRRLSCAVDPSFTITRSYNKRADQYYSNAKCYYVNAEGDRKRMISKSVGAYDDPIESRVIKLMKLYGYSIVAESTGNSRLQSDFIVEKDGNQYLVDVSLRSTDQFFKMLFTLELWSRYKDEYYLM